MPREPEHPPPLTSRFVNQTTSELDGILECLELLGDESVSLALPLSLSRRRLESIVDAVWPTMLALTHLCTNHDLRAVLFVLDEYVDPPPLPRRFERAGMVAVSARGKEKLVLCGIPLPIEPLRAELGALDLCGLGLFAVIALLLRERKDKEDGEPGSPR